MFFSGSKYVSINDMAFGWPTKYVKLDLSFKEKNKYDKAIEQGDERYNAEDYSIFINNCHSYCAYILNKLQYKGKYNYNMFIIWWIMCKESKYVSWGTLFKTYIWFVLLIMLGIFLGVFLGRN